MSARTYWVNGERLTVVRTRTVTSGEYAGKQFDELVRNGSNRVLGRVEHNGLKWLPDDALSVTA